MTNVRRQFFAYFQQLDWQTQEELINELDKLRKVMYGDGGTKRKSD